MASLPKITAFNKEKLLEDMEERDIKTLAGYENVASRVEGNGAATLALINETGESIFTQLIVLDKAHDIEEHKIKYDDSVKPYYGCDKPSERNYLCNFMKR